MKKEMKKKTTFWLFALVFFAFFLFISVFSVSLLVCIDSFIDLTGMIWYWSGLCVSVGVSLIGTVLIMRSTKRIKETTVSFWLKQNLPGLIVGYLLLIFALLSMKSQAIWTTEEVHDILSLQWTIFGLSVTIFVVWDAVVVGFLKKKQPKATTSDDALQKYKLIMEKSAFSQEVNTTYTTVILLTINLFLLLISTTQIYINNKPDSVFTQILLHGTYFFTTNSIICLFLDILKPLRKEKAEMLKNNTMTKEDVDAAQVALFAQAVIDGIKAGVMSLDSEKRSEDEKKELLIEYLEAFGEHIRSKEKSESDD